MAKKLQCTIVRQKTVWKLFREFLNNIGSTRKVNKHHSPIIQVNEEIFRSKAFNCIELYAEKN